MTFIGVFTSWFIYNKVLVTLLWFMPVLNFVEVWARDMAITYFLVNSRLREVTEETILAAINKTLNALVLCWLLTLFI